VGAAAPILRLCIWRTNFEAKRKLHDQNEWAVFFRKITLPPIGTDGGKVISRENTTLECALGSDLTDLEIDNPINIKSKGRVQMPDSAALVAVTSLDTNRPSIARAAE
jgi:hypothetical protein